MSVILMTTLFYKTLILQGEIWCWSVLGIKGLRAVVNERSPLQNKGIMLRNYISSSRDFTIRRRDSGENAA